MSNKGLISGKLCENFEFVDYKILPDNKKIHFNFRINFLNDSSIEFCEEIELPEAVDFKELPKFLIEKLFSGLHLMLGVSYYKLYCPQNVKFSYEITKNEAEFWNKVYREGLGEFYYRNNLSPLNAPKFSFSKKAKTKPSKIRLQDAALLGLGGGKDSILAGEILKEAKINVKGFVVPQSKRTSEIINESVKIMGIDYIEIRRKLDPKILDYFEGSYDGHVPVSGVFAFLGLLTAVLYGFRYIIVGNEQSSNFGNTEKDGVIINHQWSKSSEFEMLFQGYVKENITPDAIYFSLLRPLHEIKIVRLFTEHKEYLSSFTSCNRNFRIQKIQKGLWCCKCPKCVFVYTLFSAFLSKEEMEKIFTRNLYEDESLLPIFKDILGVGDMKPFDCVGTFEEARVAFYLARKEFGESVIMRKIGKLSVSEKDIDEVFKNSENFSIPRKFRSMLKK